MLSENGNGMVMPVSPMNGGIGGSYGWGDGSFWIIVLFLFALMGNGWGNGNGGGTGADIQRGFDQQAVMSGVNDLGTAVATGFAGAEISRCNTQATLLQSLNDLAMSMQNCCCENRAQTADLKYTIATEAAATRANDQANTQLILDKLCQQEIDALKAQNANLQTQINLANLTSSQAEQTARILADNSAQTQALEQYLNPAPIPAYVVQNPNCCGTNYYNGCGCSA